MRALVAMTDHQPSFKEHHPFPFSLRRGVGGRFSPSFEDDSRTASEFFLVATKVALLSTTGLQPVYDPLGAFSSEDASVLSRSLEQILPRTG